MCIRFFFFSSRRRHTRSCLVSWARRCVQETGVKIDKRDFLHNLENSDIPDIKRKLGPLRAAVEESKSSSSKDSHDSKYKTPEKTSRHSHAHSHEDADTDDTQDETMTDEKKTKNVKSPAISPKSKAIKKTIAIKRTATQKKKNTPQTRRTRLGSSSSSSSQSKKESESKKAKEKAVKVNEDELPHPRTRSHPLKAQTPVPKIAKKVISKDKTVKSTGSNTSTSSQSKRKMTLVTTQNNAEMMQQTVIENWISCDKCHKWRKIIPGRQIKNTKVFQCKFIKGLDCSTPEENWKACKTLKYDVKVQERLVI
eukprot:TRINITY_DN3292_c0_g1_i5.p1 TRINITY_DN3292_c0_g1~~TRINITY_DN3292_c0_g1_i5.p1  ORF type:complete len:310 (-),score=75.82 TRINITY_DN3292_c0_g1_i5:459-1388(-)